MTDIQHPIGTNGSTLLATIVKTVSLVGTLAWAFALFAFLAALGNPSPGGGWNVLAPLVVLFVATPVFVIFVLPALLFSFLGGESGAKAGACLLVAGVVVVAAIAGGPILRAMF